MELDGMETDQSIVFEGEIIRCLRALDDPSTAAWGTGQVQLIAGSLRGACDLLKDSTKRLREMKKKRMRQIIGDVAGVHAEEDAEQDEDGTETAPEALSTLTTLTEVEAFVLDPRNERLVSVAAVYLHLNRFKAYRSPGTIGFLEDVQEMALFMEDWGTSCMWAPASSHGLTFMDNGYCRTVRFHHPAFNARALLIALNFCYLERLKMVPANIDNCSGWTATTELVRRRNEVLHELRATGRRELVVELIKCQFRVEKWFLHAPAPKGDAKIEDTGLIAQNIRTLLAGVTGIVIGHPSPPCFGLDDTAGDRLGTAALPTSAIDSSARRVEQSHPVSPPEATAEAEQPETRHSREDIPAEGEGDHEQHSSNSTAQRPQNPESTMPTVVDQSACDGASKPGSPLETHTAIDDDDVPTTEGPETVAEADQPAAEGKTEVQGGKGETTEADTAKKVKKNKRRKEATKRREREEQARFEAAPAPDSNADRLNEIDAPATAGASNDAEAPTQAPAGPEPLDDAAAEVTMEDETKKEDKEKRKAKQQRRKERRRLEREAEAESKRLQDEAKAERRRQEEERRKEELDKRFEENQRRWEEERHRRLVEEAEAVEAAAARERAEQARREEAARQLLEISSQAKEAQKNSPTEGAEAHRIKKPEARRDQEACVAEETSRAQEARPDVETRQVEEMHRVEAAIPAERPRPARETEARRAGITRRDEAAQARGAEQREAAGSEQGNEANLSQTTKVRRGKEIEGRGAAENGVATGKEPEPRGVEGHAEEAYGSRVRMADAAGNGAEEASRAGEDRETQDRKTELRRRQYEYLRRIDAMERSSQQEFSSNDSRTVLARPPAADGHNCNKPPRQAPWHPGDVHGHQGNGAQRQPNGHSASQIQNRNGVLHLQAHKQACKELIEAAFRLGAVTARAEEAHRRAEEACQRAEEEYRRIDEARDRVVEARQAVRALLALPVSQPPVPFVRDPQNPQPVRGSQTGTEPDLDAWVDDFTAEQIHEHGVWDPESLYNRVPRCLAHSRARSVDRGDFALPSWRRETRE
jgi:hypothetical protein